MLQITDIQEIIKKNQPLLHQEIVELMKGKDSSHFNSRLVSKSPVAYSSCGVCNKRFKRQEKRRDKKGLIVLACRDIILPTPFRMILCLDCDKKYFKHTKTSEKLKKVQIINHCSYCENIFTESNNYGKDVMIKDYREKRDRYGRKRKIWYRRKEYFHFCGFVCQQKWIKDNRATARDGEYYIKSETRR